MKGFTLFLSALALVAAGVSGLLYFNTDNEKERLAGDLQIARAEMAQMSQKIADLSLERTEFSNQAKTLETDLNELKARSITLEARNAQLSREMTQVRDQLGGRAANDQAASRQVAELNRQLIEARATASTAAGAASAEQVAAYESRIADLQAEVGSLRRTGTIDFDGANSLQNVPANLTANVIDVGPRAAFVVLDVGSRNGAAPALEMVLRRGSVVIARVRLTDVKETYSIAQVLPKSGTGNVRPGDTASRS